MAKVIAKKLDFSRRLRREQTNAENALWDLLRSKHLSDFKFRRQHVIGPFIVDFCCIQAKLIVGLDGQQHRENRIYDRNRTRFLEQNGYKVIRYWDNEVLINPISVSSALTLALSHRRR